MKKEFKPFEKVIWRSKDYTNNVWKCAFYSHYREHDDMHELADSMAISDLHHYILPFSGNETLVGTNDMPREEVKLIYGNLIFAASDENTPPQNWAYTQYHGIGDCRIKGKGACVYLFCVPFDKFNPNDMEETKKHILTVINGRLMRVRL